MKQRENPIVNRLNKTKDEKYPDLRLEKENRLRELRKRDQAARLERVNPLPFFLPLLVFELLHSSSHESQIDFTELIVVCVTAI